MFHFLLLRLLRWLLNCKFKKNIRPWFNFDASLKISEALALLRGKKLAHDVKNVISKNNQLNNNNKHKHKINFFSKEFWYNCQINGVQKGEQDNVGKDLLFISSPKSFLFFVI